MYIAMWIEQWFLALSISEDGLRRGRRNVRSLQTLNQEDKDAVFTEKPT